MAKKYGSPSRAGIVRLTTDAYDAFAGWDWFVDPSTHLAIGSAKEGFLSNNGFKIHPIDPNEPEPWTKGEFFCDPDTVIVAVPSEGYDISYSAFLNWEKDSFLSPDGQMARFSTRYWADSGLRKKMPDVAYTHNQPPKLDIRTDLTLCCGKRFIEANVSLTNRYDEPVDVMYIYQDGAFMWMPNQNQDNATPLMLSSGSGRVKLSNRFQADFTCGKTLVSGTYHAPRGVFSGIYTDNEHAIVGIWPHYLLFSERDGDPIDLKYTDDRPRSLEEIVDLMLEEKEAYHPDFKQYKIRFVSFPVRQLPPGKTVSLRFFLIGLETDANLPAEALSSEILRQLP